MPKPIKVAVISNVPTPYRLPIFERLGKHPSLDLKVYFCSKRSAERDWELTLGNNFRYKILADAPRSHHHALSSYQVNFRIVRELSREKFDIIIIAGYNNFPHQVAISWCLLTNTPYLIHSESHHLDERKRWMKFLKRIFLTFIISRTAACFATGTYSRNYLISYGAHPERVFILPNTPDIVYFRKQSALYRSEREELKKQLGISDKIVIIYVGRLVTIKGVEYLLKAYNRLRLKRNNLCLLLVGDGVLMGSLQKTCQIEKIDDVHFIGFKQIDELPLYYGIADIFVLPSIKEPWGVVVNEAMACGLPVIVTRKVGASADLVRPGKNGFIIRERNVDDLCEALEQLIINPTLRDEMGKMSQKIIANWDYNFSVEQFLLAIEKTYARCVRNKK